MTDESIIFKLCDQVRYKRLAAHNYLKHGHTEKVYENALRNRLRKSGLKVEQQYSLPVYDEDSSLLGDFYADLYVEDKLIVELKACRALNDDHIAQVLGYLRASNKKHGLLINFRAPKLQLKKLIL